MGDHEKTDELLLALQRGLPLVPRPFAELAAQVASAEDEVLAYVKALFDSGRARRLGAIFDSASLGYASTLCAVDVPDDQIDAVAMALSPRTGITHSYLREGHPNLWFTLTAPADRMAETLAAIGREIAPLELLNLPATRRFKVEVIFGSKGAAASAPPKPARKPARRSFSDEEKAIVRSLQGNLELRADLFTPAAEAAGCSETALLDKLTAWKQDGVLRRVAVILRHHEVGFTTNGMCVWDVDEARIEEAGARLAACPEVTHCYQRDRFPGFRYNLFAMIHAASREDAVDIMKRIAGAAGLPEATIMFSVREFKKASMVYFEEGA